MPIILIRLLRKFVHLRTGLPPLVVIVFVFATSWPLMLLAEPSGNPITEPENYWWWFVVTASTVGYGDFFPESSWGHVIGVYVIVGGIATLTTVFAQLAEVIEKTKGRRMQGAVTLDIEDHVVVLGYSPGRTQRIVDELLAGGDRPVVLAAWDEVETHPMLDRGLGFVRGDLAEDDVLRRACVHRANSVLIDARDDNEALAVAVTVDHVVTTAHIVVTLRDLSKEAHFRYVNDGIRCVQWHSPHMVTEEIQAPGITEVYAELMTYGGGNTYTLRLTEPSTFGDCQAAFGWRHSATVLAVRTADQLLISPSWKTTLPPGAVLYYVGHRPITPGQLAAAMAVP